MKGIWNRLKEKSIYKYVQVYMFNNKKLYVSALYNRKRKSFENEKECAIYIDKNLIQRGQEPVNILKRV